MINNNILSALSIELNNGNYSLSAFIANTIIASVNEIKRAENHITNKLKYETLFGISKTNKPKRHKYHNLLVSIGSLSACKSFNAKQFEHKLLAFDNPIDESIHDTKQSFYNMFDFSGKVYKRANLASTLSQEKKRTTKKASASADNAFYETSAKRTYATPETSDTKHCNNDFMNYAINNKLAEKIVFSKLRNLFHGNTTKNTTNVSAIEYNADTNESKEVSVNVHELKNGNNSAYDLLMNANYPINKEDLTQELYLHLWEKALNGDYYMKDDIAIFDIMACFRIVGNMMYKYSNTKNSTYKTLVDGKKVYVATTRDIVSLEVMIANNTIDTEYIDNTKETINADYFKRLHNNVVKNGGDKNIYKILHDASIYLLCGFSIKEVSALCDYSVSGMHKLINKYIKTMYKTRTIKGTTDKCVIIPHDVEAEAEAKKKEA